jgi:hypothetical protein
MNLRLCGASQQVFLHLRACCFFHLTEGKGGPHDVTKATKCAKNTEHYLTKKKRIKREFSAYKFQILDISGADVVSR